MLMTLSLLSQKNGAKKRFRKFFEVEMKNGNGLLMTIPKQNFVWLLEFSHFLNLIGISQLLWLSNVLENLFHIYKDFRWLVDSFLRNNFFLKFKFSRRLNGHIFGNFWASYKFSKVQCKELLWIMKILLVKDTKIFLNNFFCQEKTKKIVDFSKIIFLNLLIGKYSKNCIL